MSSVSKSHLEVERPVPGVEMRQIEWGGMIVGFVSFSEPAIGLEMAPLFKGLPDDRCQAPHWGYVLKGSMHIKYANREETITAGQAYYLEPGHVPLTITEPVEFLEFTNVEEMGRTMEVMQRNMEEAKKVQAAQG